MVDKNYYEGSIKSRVIDFLIGFLGMFSVAFLMFRDIDFLAKIFLFFSFILTSFFLSAIKGRKYIMIGIMLVAAVPLTVLGYCAMNF